MTSTVTILTVWRPLRFGRVSGIWMILVELAGERWAGIKLHRAWAKAWCNKFKIMMISATVGKSSMITNLFKKRINHSASTYFTWNHPLDTVTLYMLADSKYLWAAGLYRRAADRQINSWAFPMSCTRGYSVAATSVSRTENSLVTTVIYEKHVHPLI